MRMSMKLISSEENDRVVVGNLVPTAIAKVSEQGEKKCVNIELKGVISDTSADTLKKFLQRVSGRTEDKYTLQMRDLLVISRKGLKHLLKFSQKVQRKGSAIEIVGMHKSVHAIFKDLGVMNRIASVQY